MVFKLTCFKFLLKENWYKDKVFQPETPWPWLIFCEEHVKEKKIIEYTCYNVPQYDNCHKFISFIWCSGQFVTHTYYIVTIEAPRSHVLPLPSALYPLYFEYLHNNIFSHPSNLHIGEGAKHINNPPPAIWAKESLLRGP